MEPMLRERLRDLPNRIEMARPLRFRTLSPTRVRSPLIYKIDGDQLELRGLSYRRSSAGI
jgi:hypothetical protein